MYVRIGMWPRNLLYRVQNLILETASVGCWKDIYFTAGQSIERIGPIADQNPTLVVFFFLKYFLTFGSTCGMP